MYLTQANAKLWFGILALLASGCGNRGECDFAPERCAPREVRLNLTAMERSIGGELKVSFDGEHRQSGNLIVELLPLQGEAADIDSAQELINVTPPSNMVAMNIAPNMLRTGLYQVRVRQIDHELTIPEKRPLLKVTGTQMQWNQSDPVEFMTPNELISPRPCDILSRKMNLTNVWAGRASNSQAKLTEIIVSRSYLDCDENPKVQFVRKNGPATSALDGAPHQSPSLLDIWQFPAASRQALQVIKSGTNYQPTKISLQAQEQVKSFDRLGSDSFDKMALAVSNNLPTLLFTSDQTIYGYKLLDTMPIKMDVAQWPAGSAKIRSVIGYADSTTGMIASGVGFVLIDEPGIPYRLRIENGSIVYDSAGTGLLQKVMSAESSAPVALAAGDLNGDDLTDLAVLRSDRTVSFYLRRIDGSFYAASSMKIPDAIKQPSAIAIGQVDGLGFSDLLIGDSQPQVCAQTFCNMVSVFLNASTVVN